MHGCSSSLICYFGYWFDWLKTCSFWDRKWFVLQLDECFSSLFLPAEWKSFRPFDAFLTYETLMLSNSVVNIKSGTALAMPAVLVPKTELRAVSFT